MKQVLLRKGLISVEDVPVPILPPNNILVEVTKSLISSGTEAATVQQSGVSLASRARQKPADASKVVDSIRLRGVLKTFQLVRNKLDESMPLGYSCAGRVIAVGTDVTQFRIGDRVGCAGSGFANHAEIISVPATLAVSIPENVSDVSAAFVTLGSIALQGVRRSEAKIGETVCVIGLGLIGQLTVQLLKAAGCRVAGIDLDPARVELALKHGLTWGTTSAEELEKKLESATGGMGADATILTAATESSEPAQQAFQLTRKKGRIVVVGAVGMDLKRSPFYEKEQDFLISCSYGPGRYDSAYENEGRDYPYAFVRWTENRNMSAFLELVSQNKISVEPLIEKEFSVSDAPKAYELLNQNGAARPLALVLIYPGGVTVSGKAGSNHKVAAIPSPKGKIRLGLIGVGSFARSTHIPNLQALSNLATIAGVCTTSSPKALSLGRQLKATLIASDYHEILDSADIDAVLISTRHNRHAEIALAALRKGKHVFLEKPAALNEQELNELNDTIEKLNPRPVFMVDFNRRFAPTVKSLQKALTGRTTPLMAVYQVNAGEFSADHWTKTAEGGGRLRGEACHMIDLFQALVGSPLKEISIEAISAGGSGLHRPDENFSAQFSYEDGSLCSLIYTSLGNNHLGKERLEVHWEGASAVIEDYSRFEIYGKPGGSQSKRPDKGHKACLETFFNAIRTGHGSPIPWDQLYETTETAIRLDQAVWGKSSEPCAAS